MNTPVLDNEKCTTCGLCAEVCGLDAIVRNGNTCPTIDHAAYCHTCGHCVAICPQDALSIQDIARDEFAPMRASTISPLDMETLLLTKRSCREFQDRPVGKSVIEKLIFFTGISMDPSGRDRALGAQHYLMLYAETLGLGTCINGYAQSAPKVLTKHLNVPKAHTIYGAIKLGYRRYTYRKRVHRKPASVVYYE